MSDFLKDLSGVFTLPVIYIFILSVIIEAIHRLTSLELTDSSLHYSGGVFVGLSILVSVVDQLNGLKDV